MTQQPPGPPYPPQPPYPGYGPPMPYGAPPPDHPQATTVLVLGIVSIVVCGLVGPFAWVMGNRVVREIDASNGAWGGRSSAQVGRVLGIIETCLLIAGLVGLALLVVIAVIPVSSGSS